MRVAIIETGHFQFAITQAEILSECDITCITTASLRQQILEYSPEMARHQFMIISTIEHDYRKILAFIEHEKVDLVLISPIFDSYAQMHLVVKRVKAIKVITTHNINTWFNGRFWSPRSLMDRIHMRGIIKYSDYISVEDFIYTHLKSTNHPYFQKHKFIYIPFTVFNNTKPRKYAPDNSRLKVVLTGHIDGDRRRYEDALDVIEHFKERSADIHFSFAGRAKGDYGRSIKQKLIAYRTSYPDLVSFFEDDSTADMFRREMETSHLVLSMSTLTFKGMGTTEYIGKTKPTAAIHDMVSFELPGLLPAHLPTPANLTGSAYTYKSVTELVEILTSLLNDRNRLAEWLAKAKANSLNFTPKKIREGLPF